MRLNRINYRSLFANTWLLLGVAVATAGGITWLTYGYITTNEARIKAEAESRQRHPGVSVVVPNSDVPAGTALASGLFVAREIPADLVYDDMLRAGDFDQFRLATLVKPVRRGRPLRAQDIDALRARDFSDTLPAGMRALTLTIDTVNSTDSMLRPGNRVDLYWLGSRRGAAVADGTGTGGDAQSILLLLPDVLVMATGNDTRPRDAGEAARDMADGASADRYSTVTLQVPVAEATRIVLAQRLGTVRLILRNSEDKAKPPERLDDTRLFAATSGSVTAAPDVVEIIRGGGGSTVSTQVASERDAPAPKAASSTTALAASPQPASASPRPAERPRHDPATARQQVDALARRLQAAIDAAGASR